MVVVDDEGCFAPTTTCAGTGPGPSSTMVVAGCRASCRYHGWAYGLDGRLRSARLRPTDGWDPAGVAGAAVDDWRGLVFVNLGLDRRVPLLEALGTFADQCEPYPMEDLVPTQEVEHELACNWKAYADNYLEGYHIPLVHPGLNKEIDARRYVVDVDERHRWVRHSAPARDGAVNAGRWLWRWPNLALNLYPGGMNVERYDPVAPDRTARYSYSFLRPDDHEASEAVLRMSAQVTAEDAAICESVQRNLASSAAAGSRPAQPHQGGVAASAFAGRSTARRR